MRCEQLGELFAVGVVLEICTWLGGVSLTPVGELYMLPGCKSFFHNWSKLWNFPSGSLDLYDTALVRCTTFSLVNFSSTLGRLGGFVICTCTFEFRFAPIFWMFNLSPFTLQLIRHLYVLFLHHVLYLSFEWHMTWFCVALRIPFRHFWKLSDASAVVLQLM